MCNNIVKWTDNIYINNQPFYFNETICIDDQKDNYTFSFVVAVYNSEPYIEKTIESIISQDIGFKEHCQLILVDDGSTDKSGEICDRYAKEFPENIVVVHKSNNGVSSARNVGMLFVKGRYINFIDSDDYFSLNVCSSIHSFFNKYETSTDVVTINTIMFGAKTGASWFNKKMNKGRRIINLWKEPHVYLNSVNNCFFHRRIKNQLHFDEKLSISEDLKVVNTVLMNKYKLGIEPGCTYYYNIKSEMEPSLAGQARYKDVWYTPYLEYVCHWFIDLCNKRMGFIPTFLQLTLLRDLYNRFDNNTQCRSVLTKDTAFQDYKKKLFDAIFKIDDILFYSCEFINKDYILYFMSQKYGVPLIFVNGSSVKYHWNNGIKDLEKKTYMCYERSDVVNSNLILEGYVIFDNIGIPESEFSIKLKCNNTSYFVDIYNNTSNNQIAFADEVIFYRKYFKAIIPTESISSEMNAISVAIRYGDTEVPVQMYGIGRFFGVNNNCKHAYYSKNGVCLTFNKNELCVSNCTRRKILSLEISLLKYLYKNHENPYFSAALKMRLINLLPRIRHSWLISDRNNAAGDNGQAFYEYMKKKKRIKTHYVISGKSEDYKELKSMHYNVLDSNSKRYVLNYINADCIISSNFDSYELLPYCNNDYIRDIIAKKKFVFLQHGITKDDVSKYYSRKKQNLDLFICASEKECESIRHNNNYFCSDKEAIVTGFARYDKLQNNDKKIILIMPTWRNNLVKFNSTKPQIIDNFEKTYYYKFYHNLLSDKKLHEIAKKFGYKICYFPHQNMTITNDYFMDINDIEMITGLRRNYKKYFAESSIMITDYSSTAFDFAYLRKMVIYCQGDWNLFYKNHTYTEGYFDYKKDGFGPVTYSLESLITELEFALENRCELPALYQNRIGQFFKYNDKNNCRRIYDAIRKLT